MHREVFARNEGCNRERVEYFHKQIVNLLVVMLKHLLSESKRFSHVSGLVVTAQKNETFWLIKFDRKK